MQKTSGTDDAAIQVERALWLYTFLMVGVTVASWVVYAYYPTFDRRPLFALYDRYHDLTNYIYKIRPLYHGAAALGSGQPIFTYPAPAAFVYRVLLLFPHHPLRVYLAILLTCLFGLAILFWRATGGTNPRVRSAAAAAIVTTAGMAYPLWFVVDRGNIEGVPWAFSAVGLCFFLRARYRIAAVLIGLAASIKPFPILFLFLFLPRRRFKEAVIAVVTTGAVTVAALTYMGPNPWRAYQELRPGIALYTGQYLTRLAPVEEARFLHSILDGMKSAALVVQMRGIHPIGAIVETIRLQNQPGGWDVIAQLVKIYPFIAGTGFVLLLWVFRKLPLLNQMIALSVAVTLFPYSAADYTLLHLLIPFGALVVFVVREVAEGKQHLRYGAMLAFAVIYGLLFAPLTFLRLYAGDAKLLLLITLLILAARFPMQSESYERRSDDVARTIAA